MRIRTALVPLIGAILAGCSQPDGEAIAACYAGTDSAAMCVEQQLIGDDYAYAMSTCASASGRMERRCPSENLVGVCSRTANVATSAGFQPREVRVFQYRHPDVRDERATERLAARCADGTWLAAEELHDNE